MKRACTAAGAGCCHRQRPPGQPATGARGSAPTAPRRRLGAGTGRGASPRAGSSTIAARAFRRAAARRRRPAGSSTTKASVPRKRCSCHFTAVPGRCSPRQRLQRHPAALGVAALEVGVAVAGGQHLAPGLVVPDRDPRPQPLEEAPHQPRLGLGEGPRPRVVAARSRHPAVPAKGEVAVEVDPAGVAPGAAGDAVGVDRVDGPEVDAADPRVAAAQLAHHLQPGGLIAVDRAHHQRLAGAARVAQPQRLHRPPLDRVPERHDLAVPPNPPAAPAPPALRPAPPRAPPPPQPPAFPAETSIDHPIGVLLHSRQRRRAHRNAEPRLTRLS